MGPRAGQAALGLDTESTAHQREVGTLDHIRTKALALGEDPWEGRDTLQRERAPARHSPAKDNMQGTERTLRLNREKQVHLEHGQRPGDTSTKDGRAQGHEHITGPQGHAHRSPVRQQSKPTRAAKGRTECAQCRGDLLSHE